MKVLLIEDVDNLGYAGDVKTVANGYGRNYLIPQRLAVLATPGALKQAETIRKAAEKRRAHEKEDAEAIASQLVGLELLFERRAGETGKLYGSVTSADIAEAIEAKTGIALDKRKVALPEPIRNLGEQEVLIKLMIEVKTTIKVEVLPQGGILERSRLEEAELEALVEDGDTAEADETEPSTTVDETIAQASEEATPEPSTTVDETTAPAFEETVDEAAED